MTRMFLSGVVALALGLWMGAHVLPAALTLPRTIRPEGDHGVHRFGPFVAGTFTSSDSITVGSEGEIALALQNGEFARVGSVELPVTRPAYAFDALHLGIEESTPPGSQLFVQVRVTDAATGVPSRWQTLEREGELTLARPASEFQVRMVLNSSTGRDTPRLRAIAVTACRREVEMIDETPGQGAAIESPEIVSRSMWGARPPKDAYSSHTPVQLTVHHSSQPTQGNYQGAASIRGIQSFHQGPERGWSDIGYHFLIGPEGKIFEGRPPTAIGAHSPPNTGKVGVCLIGNFENSEIITDAQRGSLVKLLSHLCGKFKIPAARIKGHRDHQSTDCPGSSVYAILPDIRKQVGDAIASAQQE